MQKRYHQLPLRLPVDIADRLKAHAEKNGLSMNETVVKALEQYTGEPEARERALDAVAQTPSPGLPARGSTLAPPSFKCPVQPACAFRAPSSAARCPSHGRLVVPA